MTGGVEWLTTTAPIKDATGMVVGERVIEYRHDGDSIIWKFAPGEGAHPLEVLDALDWSWPTSAS